MEKACHFINGREVTVEQYRGLAGHQWLFLEGKFKVKLEGSQSTYTCPSSIRYWLEQVFVGCGRVDVVDFIKKERNRSIHGDTFTRKLKHKPQNTTISGKPKRKILKKWKRSPWYKGSVVKDHKIEEHYHLKPHTQCRKSRKMIPEPGDANRETTVTETFHLQTDDELSDKKLKQIEADDQAIQT
nr:hypothetical protein [Tanacetum cinerariifolium]